MWSFDGRDLFALGLWGVLGIMIMGCGEELLSFVLTLLSFHLLLLVTLSVYIFDRTLDATN